MQPRIWVACAKSYLKSKPNSMVKEDQTVKGLGELAANDGLTARKDRKNDGNANNQKQE